MVHFRTLREEEIDKWLDFLVNDIFIGEPRSYFSNQWVCDPQRDIEGIFVAVDEEDNFLSTIRVFPRELYIAGERIFAGGIGSVGTKESHRGQGLSTTIFTMCQKYMVSKGMKVSWLLCGEHNESFYQRFGYNKSPFVRKISDTDAGATKYKAPLLLRDAVFPYDIPALSLMYENFSGKHNGPTVRDKEYWTWWVSSFGGGKYKIATDNEGSPIAYINFDLDESTIFIFDFGYMEGYSDVFDSFITCLSTAYENTPLKVVYQSTIFSKMPVMDQLEMCLIMYKLILPFQTCNLSIADSDALLHVLHGDSQESKLLLWEVDDV